MALQSLDKALALSRSCGDIDRQCGVLIDIADIQSRIGEPVTAHLRVVEARKLANFSGNLYQESSALWIEAECKAQLGNYRDSATCLDRAKEILGVCGMSGGLADSNVEMSRATVHLLKSEYTEARNINLGVLGNTDHDPHVYARALINIAEIDVIIGATAQDVQQNMNEAKVIFSASQYRDGVTSCEVILADLELREGDTFSAKTLFRKCLSSTWGREVQLTSFALERLADGSRWHSIEHTPKWSVIYLCHAHQSKEKLEIHKALFFLGEVFASDQDQQTARNLFNVALEGFTLMDVHRSKARCMLGLGDLENEAGNQSKAVEFWKAARPLFKRSSQANQIVQIDTRLAATRTIKPII
jgi:tetratricopeptide (TPR) repeat protein